ncbi:hypothetical protein B0A48_16775 [Cryoendolithus antarcticus]|uniref:GDP-mannose transporter n=1 Tax=Cryoendolithus antarcticus TaxID=1507870 RepID=A0A1V8SDR3_9PEZI|nr:hypothetical protein B0A48_16775 [Cryoendolithus antarcticus]
MDPKAYESDDDSNEEKKFLQQHDDEEAQIQSLPKKAEGFSNTFWAASGLNVVATVSIVFVSKHIFQHAALRHAQVAFAASHFAATALFLYVVSRPRLNFFQAKRVPVLKIIPLAVAFIFSVVFTNASLAYCSIQFYQIVRALGTPFVAFINYLTSGATIPLRAALTLVPVCAGIAVVGYFDTDAKKISSEKGTTPLGVVFAFTALVASGIYTVWIGRYHKLLDCTSQQLLLNQTPVSVLIMLYVIPFSDDVTAWKGLDVWTWLLVALSCILAVLINLSQFFIINEAGPVASTVVGHFKTCTIVVLGWIWSRKPLKDGSLVGIVLAIGGIIAYSVITQQEARK